MSLCNFLISSAVKPVSPVSLRQYKLCHCVTMSGLQELVGLHELDLANNCLCCHDDMQPIRPLKKLRQVSDGRHGRKLSNSLSNSLQLDLKSPKEWVPLSRI